MTRSRLVSFTEITILPNSSSFKKRETFKKKPMKIRLKAEKNKD